MMVHDHTWQTSDCTSAMNILVSVSSVTFGGVSVVLGRLLSFVFVQHLQLALGGLVGWVQLYHFGEHSDSLIILMKINQHQA